MKSVNENIPLKSVEILKIEEKELGDRCCIDLTSRFIEGLGLAKGCGLLVGSSAKGLFLIHAENIENPFASQRPFRVNAGPVSLYALVPPRGENGNYPTKYLCELGPGDKVLTVDYRGHVAEGVVARNKIERRPLTMITALHPTLINPYTNSLDFIHTFVQTAETTHLVNEMGDPMPLTKLERGDKVLAYAENPEEIARHFGTPVPGARILENPHFI